MTLESSSSSSTRHESASTPIHITNTSERKPVDQYIRIRLHLLSIHPLFVSRPDRISYLRRHSLHFHDVNDFHEIKQDNFQRIDKLDRLCSSLHAGCHLHITSFSFPISKFRTISETAIYLSKHCQRCLKFSTRSTDTVCNGCVI